MQLGKIIQIENTVDSLFIIVMDLLRKEGVLNVKRKI